MFEMPPLLGGLSYAHATMCIYLHFGCVLIGVEETEEHGRGCGVVLNPPLTYTICAGDLGFVGTFRWQKSGCGGSSGSGSSSGSGRGSSATAAATAAPPQRQQQRHRSGNSSATAAPPQNAPVSSN
jgi:hypothetical protein